MQLSQQLSDVFKPAAMLCLLQDWRRVCHSLQCKLGLPQSQLADDSCRLTQRVHFPCPAVHSSRHKPVWPVPVHRRVTKGAGILRRGAGCCWRPERQAAHQKLCDSGERKGAPCGPRLCKESSSCYAPAATQWLAERSCKAAVNQSIKQKYVVDNCRRHLMLHTSAGWVPAQVLAMEL